MRQMIKLVFGFMFCVALVGNLAAGNQGVPSLFEIRDQLPANYSARIQGIAPNAVYLQINQQAFASIFNEKRPLISIDIPLTDRETIPLVLERFDILTPQSRIVEGTAQGDREHSLNDQFLFYKGFVRGIPHSFVSVNFTTERGVFGLISMDKKELVLASLAGEVGMSRDDYILYSIDQITLPNDFRCHSDIFEIPQDLLQTIESLPIPSRPGFSSSDLLEVEVALESDYETYTHFGNSISNASSYLLSLMATVSAIYTRDVNVKLVVPYLRIWSTPADPYQGEDSYTLLIQFRNYWNTHMQAVQRDLAHYISTRPGGLGGIAWINALCSSLVSGNGYAFSDIHGSFSGLPVYSWDLNVVSHELGHNFGSLHTHSCYWPAGPIDTCYVSEENDFCVNTMAPREGTIMSYCHLTAHVVLNFHPLPIGVMRQNAEQASCISISNEPISLVKPNGGESFYTLEDVYIIWGSNLGGDVGIQYSPDGGVSWHDIVTQIPAGTRSFTWTIPYIPSTHQALLKIYDSANPQIADISDAPFSIQTRLWSFENLAPPTFSTIMVAPEDPTPIQFSWNRAGDIPGITYKLRLFSLSNDRTKILSNNNGQDTTATVTAGQIDSILTAWGAWSNVDSVRIRWTARAYLDDDSLQATPIQYLFFRRNPTSISFRSEGSIPARYSLSSNFPNPFNPSTTIYYGLPEASEVELSIFNPLGQRIRTLVKSYQIAGKYEVKWDGKNQFGQSLPSGIYLYYLQTASFSLSRKMLLLR
ncbi:MAG: hypothetical protein Kow0042_11370 [Calditrichia bacterium]